MKQELIGIVDREAQAALEAGGEEPDSGNLWNIPNIVDGSILRDFDLPEDVRAKRWEELADHWPDRVAAQIQLMVQLAPPATVRDLVSAGHSPEAAQAAMDAVTAFHDSLPLTNPERRWLADTFVRVGGYHHENTGLKIFQRVREMHGNIITGGRRQAVSGAELTDRVWDWWRQAGDYAPGVGSVDEAKTALEGIVLVFRGDES